MHGFIDLFFEHNAKYYILDWKSNHLGDDISCYEYNRMDEAMKGSNYHLQSYIYMVAVKQFLEFKGVDFYDKFGGIIYLFIRGTRSGKTNGVFFNSPKNKLVDKLEGMLCAQSAAKS
jgi:exodeoxyribonuclease V beta subunit